MRKFLYPICTAKSRITTPFSAKSIRRSSDILSSFRPLNMLQYASIASFQFLDTLDRKGEEGLMSHLALPVCVRARGEVSSSNKRKVALRILLLLPHTDHHNLPPSPPLSYRSSSSFSSTTASSSSTAVFSASLPRNRAYLSLRSCKQSNSKLPAIVTHGVTVTTEPGEALRIAEEKDVEERMGKGKEKRSDPLRGTLEAEVSTHLIGSRL